MHRQIATYITSKHSNLGVNINLMLFFLGQTKINNVITLTMHGLHYFSFKDTK